MAKCKYCGARMNDGVTVCPSCGMAVGGMVVDAKPGQRQAPVQPQPQSAPAQPYAQPAQNYAQPVQNYAQPAQNYAPPAQTYAQPVQPQPAYSQGQVQGAPKVADSKFTINNLFSAVFQYHGSKQMRDVLAAGIAGRRGPNVIDASKMQPWVWSRVFLILAGVFAIFEVCILAFGNVNMLPGTMIIGSLVMPFCILVLYFELNVHKDISLFNVVVYFLLGGAFSVLCTLIIDTYIAPDGILTLEKASLVSIAEEIGKLLPVIAILNHKKSDKMLNGLLIGGAIGAGFAVFESAGYAFTWFVNADYDLNVMNRIIFRRAFFAFGGHVAWAAISGAAFAKEGKVNFGFLKYFAAPFVLHALWDWDAPTWQYSFGIIDEALFKARMYNVTLYNFALLALSVIAWVFVIHLVNVAAQDSATKTAAPADSIAILDINGVEIPLNLGAKIYMSQIDNAASTGIAGEVIANKKDPRIWGIINQSGKAWIEVTPYGSMESIDNGKTIPIARGIEIQFPNKLTGVIK